MEKATMMKYGRSLAWLAGIVLVGWLIASRLLVIDQDPIQDEVARPNPVGPTSLLLIGQVQLPVEVRRSQEELALGLSFRTSLAAEQGMAFVYSKPQQVMYWMKGMEFPLDFIFVARGIVVEITEGVPAPTEENPVPRTVVPAQEVDMVIEVNSGFVRQYGIRVGDVVTWQNYN